MVEKLLDYKDTVTFVRVQSNGYGNTKVVLQQVDVPCIFLQDTNFNESNMQEGITSDAICFPDPENSFVVENENRLEGMFVVAPLFGQTDAQAWYQISSVTVNRDHLLTNTIDNIELALTKASAIPGVS